MSDVLWNLLALAAVCVWLAFLCGISISENWMKYKLPGWTLSLPVRNTRFMFSALDKIEIMLAALIAVAITVQSSNPFAPGYISFFIPVASLMIQRAALMPALGRRAERLAYRAVIAPARLNRYHVCTELLKASSLLVFSWQLL